MSLLAESQRKLDLAAKNADPEARYSLFREALNLYAVHHNLAGNVIPADMISAVKTLDAADIRLTGARRRLSEARASLTTASERTTAANARSLQASDFLKENPSAEAKMANQIAFNDAQVARRELGRVSAAFVKVREEYFDAFNYAAKHAATCAYLLTHPSGS